MVGEVTAGERVTEGCKVRRHRKKNLQDNSDLACVNMKKERE